MLRLGYACKNLSIPAPVSQTCRIDTVLKNGLSFVVEKARSNLVNTLQCLKWNERNNIRFYRMSTNLFPHIVNPDPRLSHYTNKDRLYSLFLFLDELTDISKFAKTHQHRLTMHASHFCKIGAKDKDVFKKTLDELALYSDMMDLMRLGPDSIIVVHGGGVYGDIEETKKRWVKQFNLLPETVQRRLVLENCEFQYGVQDVFDICEQIKRPAVIDTHHYHCYTQKGDHGMSLYRSIQKSVELWQRFGAKPKFHISQQATGQRLGAHSNYIDEIDNDLLAFVQNTETDIDIMVEAKAKEKAVLQLVDHSW